MSETTHTKVAFPQPTETKSHTKSKQAQIELVSLELYQKQAHAHDAREWQVLCHLQSTTESCIQNRREDTCTSVVQRVQMHPAPWLARLQPCRLHVIIEHASIPISHAVHTVRNMMRLGHTIIDEHT